MEGYISEIRLWAANFAPQYWLFCQGQILAISSNTALFSLLGTTYGGNGSTTFALPDLRGRVPVGVGAGPGLTSRSLGQQGGFESVTLTTTHMPAHTHTVASALLKAQSGAANQKNPANAALAAALQNIYSSAAPNTSMGANTVEVTLNSTGGSQAHENMPPFQGLNFIICVQGLYPSRP